MNKKTYINTLLFLFCFMLFFVIYNHQNSIIKNMEKENETLLKNESSYIYEIEMKDKEISNKENENNYLKNKNEELTLKCENNVVKFMELIEPLKEKNKQAYFEQYKKIVEEYYDVFDAPETIYDYYSKNDINMMCRCIETEVYQASFDAKVNVACVILARVDNPKFPSTPSKVVTSPSQFAYHRSKISEDTILALEYAFMFGNEHNECIAFRSDKNPKKWNNWNYVYTDGYHYFYK